MTRDIPVTSLNTSCWNKKLPFALAQPIILNRMETRKVAIEQLSKFYVPFFTPIILIGCQAYLWQNQLTTTMSTTV